MANPNGNGNGNNACNCKKNKCLQLSCKCFKVATYCDSCACNNCYNTSDNEQVRRESMVAVLKRKPNFPGFQAFKREMNLEAANEAIASALKTNRYVPPQPPALAVPQQPPAPQPPALAAPPQPPALAAPPLRLLLTPDKLALNLVVEAGSTEKQKEKVILQTLKKVLSQVVAFNTVEKETVYQADTNEDAEKHQAVPESIQTHKAEKEQADTNEDAEKHQAEP